MKRISKVVSGVAIIIVILTASMVTFIEFTNGKDGLREKEVIKDAQFSRVLMDNERAEWATFNGTTISGEEINICFNSWKAYQQTLEPEMMKKSETWIKSGEKTYTMKKLHEGSIVVNEDKSMTLNAVIVFADQSTRSITMTARLPQCKEEKYIEVSNLDVDINGNNGNLEVLATDNDMMIRIRYANGKQKECSFKNAGGDITDENGDYHLAYYVDATIKNDNNMPQLTADLYGSNGILYHITTAKDAQRHTMAKATRPVERHNSSRLVIARNYNDVNTRK